MRHSVCAPCSRCCGATGGRWIECDMITCAYLGKYSKCKRMTVGVSENNSKALILVYHLLGTIGIETTREMGGNEMPSVVS